MLPEDVSAQLDNEKYAAKLVHELNAYERSSFKIANLLNQRANKIDAAELTKEYGKFDCIPEKLKTSDEATVIHYYQQSIVNILDNYIHPRSGRFFSGHWNRHHRKLAKTLKAKAQACLTSREGVAEFKTELESCWHEAYIAREILKNGIKGFEAGSFNRRCTYIAQHLKQLCQKPRKPL